MTPYLEQLHQILIFAIVALSIIVGPQFIYFIGYQFAWIYPKNWLENSESSEPGKKALALSQVLFLIGWALFGYYIWFIVTNRDAAFWLYEFNPLYASSDIVLARIGASVGAVLLLCAGAAKISQLRAEGRFRLVEKTLLAGLLCIVAGFALAPVNAFRAIGFYNDQFELWALLIAAILLHISFANYLATTAAAKGKSYSSYLGLSLLPGTLVTFIVVAVTPWPKVAEADSSAEM